MTNATGLRWVKMVIRGAMDDGVPAYPHADVCGPLAVHRGISGEWGDAWAVTDMPTGKVLCYARYKRDARSLVGALLARYPRAPATPGYTGAARAAVYQTLADRATRWRTIADVLFLPGQDGY